MSRHLGYTLVLVLVLLFAPAKAADISSMGDMVEALLEQRTNYFDRQAELIKQQEALLLESSDKRERFDICYNIFNLSRSYKYKIAYRYANQALKLAEQIGDKELIVRALAAKISAFTSGGLFTAAAEIIASSDISGVSDQVRREYLYNVVRYYSDQRDYAYESEYRHTYTEKIIAYADSIINLTTTPDYYDAYAKAYRESSLGNQAAARDALLEFYGSTNVSEHHDSIITFLLALAYFELGDEDNGFKYLEKSISHDIRAAARENRSIKTMAQHLFDRGESSLSDRLINIAFEDAKFYNARHRNLEINSLLPIINERKIQIISRQRNVLYALLVVISLLTICSVVAVVFARRTERRIRLSRATIREQLEVLARINGELVESNNIKEHYVIESIHKSHEHLRHMEALLKKIDTKVKNKLYGDLHTIYKEFNLKTRRASFFEEFDSAFLKLFPNFIEEYNSLFAPADQINLSQTSELPAEVRIFALMRLGITDNDRISHFLDLSINTIYTYKTKVKGRALIPKEEFEERILRIKLSV